MSIYHRLRDKKKQALQSTLFESHIESTTSDVMSVVNVPKDCSINVGLNDAEKIEVIKQYCKTHDIRKIFMFYPPHFPLTTQIENIIVDYTQYVDMFQFKYYYKLLENINNQSLIVFNECLRNQDRKVITYSAAHDFARNTPHVLVFEYFPFIENPGDFMVLLELINPAKYKNKPFNYTYLSDEKVSINRVHFTIRSIDKTPSNDEIKRYGELKEKAFAEIGDADPDVIPRRLHLFAGDLKKSLISKNHRYIARTNRFGSNIVTYRCLSAGKQDYYVLDFPCRRLEFNDFLKLTKTTDVVFLNSGLKVDAFYLGDFKEWITRLEDFYAKTSVQ
jgi:hypothetical protein